jgi:ketosteroid isomerase-like protein
MRRILISLTALILLLAPQLAFGTDVDDLKATDERWYQAWNSRDIDRLKAIYHDSWVTFGKSNPFPQITENNDEFWQRIKDWFAIREVVNGTQIDPQYRVVGNTGIVWGHTRRVVKQKDGPQETTYRRFMRTYVKLNGKWLLIARHASAIPSGS